MKGKGTIMEIRDNSMVIMTSDCAFEEIKRRSHVMVGMEIEFKQQDIIRQKNSYFKPLATMAAAIIILITSSVFFIGNFKAEATSIGMVTLDINPSIALEINHKQKVVKILPLNEDAERLPINSLEGQDIRYVVNEIMKIIKEEGYLEEIENYILLTTVSFEEEEEEALTILAEELKTNIEKETEKKDGKNVVVLTLDSNYQTLMKAQEEKTSVGKMEFYQRLEAGSGKEGLKLQEVKTKKVKELVEVSEQKEHPIFDQHPGKKNQKEKPEMKDNNKNEKDEKNLKTEEKNNPNNKVNSNNKQDKEHPVFNQHPGKNKEKENPTIKDNEKENKSKVEEKKSDEDKEKNKKKVDDKRKKNN